MTRQLSQPTSIAEKTQAEIRKMLALLPEPGEREWDEIEENEFEAKFLTSVRDQFNRKGQLSKKQYEVLERIYRKYA